MPKFEVRIHEANEYLFLTSFTHPLIKKKVRKTFNKIGDAEKYKKEFEHKFSRKEASSYSGLTLEELLVIFINNEPDNPFVKSKTHLIDFFDTFREFQIEEISTSALKIWMDQVERENNLTTSSMGALKFQLETFFRFLEERDIIANSPIREIRYKRRTCKPLATRNLLSPEEMRDLLLAVKIQSPGYLYPITLFFVETAAKVSEMCELKWQDVDLDAQTIHFNAGTKIQERTLKVSDELTELLHMKSRYKKVVFENYRKIPFNKNTLTAHINEFKKLKTFRKDWTPSDLRHSHAVNFLASGGSFKELQYRLGLKSTQHAKAAYADALKLPKKTIIHPFQ